MAVIGQLEKALGTGEQKVNLISATGPAVDVSVAAGAAADVSISISIAPLTSFTHAYIKRIAGLPDGICLVGFNVTATEVVLRVFNPTTAAITVTAGSVTVELGVIGY